MILGIILCWVFAITLFLIVKYFWWKNNGEDNDKQHYILNLADNRKGEHRNLITIIEVSVCMCC